MKGQSSSLPANSGPKSARIAGGFEEREHGIIACINDKGWFLWVMVVSYTDIKSDKTAQTDDADPQHSWS